MCKIKRNIERSIYNITFGARPILGWGLNYSSLILFMFPLSVLFLLFTTKTARVL